MLFYNEPSFLNHNADFWRTTADTTKPVWVETTLKESAFPIKVILVGYKEAWIDVVWKAEKCEKLFTLFFSMRKMNVKK
jgi:hypothetical protein